MAQSDYNDPAYDYLDYWKGREYENLAEECALDKLLPRKGIKLLDVGGGYGRLAPVYTKVYSQVTICDMSKKILNQAQVFTKGQGLEVITVESNIYDLAKNVPHDFDCAVMVRVTHHLDNLAKAFDQIYQVLRPGGIFILEFANKAHFKSLTVNLVKLNLGYFSQKPVSRAATSKVNFFNFHPRYVTDALKKTGFKVDRKLSVSNLRLPTIKKFLSQEQMLDIENRLQKPLSYVYFGPSIFIRCAKPKDRS